MVLKLVHVWSTAANGTSAPVAPSLTQADIDDEEFSSNDPDIPEYLLDRKKAKQHERGLAAAAERSHQERQVAAEREKQDEDDAERERQAWLNSDYYRTAVQELSDDIHDAREAIGFATARAAQEQREARAALESTQREALLVSGKRAYFTRDGRHLYGEDQREITDQATLAEARRQLEHRPDAPAYEDYVARKLAAQLANEKAERLGAICSPAGSTRSEGAGRQSQPRRPCRGPQGSPRCH